MDIFLESFKKNVLFLLEKFIYFGLFCRVPGITIATDVICGFPAETEEVSSSYITK